MPKIQVRRGASTGTGSWTTVNPTLSAGEWGYETDTGKFKIGDGTTAWNSLTYAKSGANSAVDFGLSVGSNLTMSNGVTSYNGSAATQINLASTITATLSGNATSATTLQTSRNINGTAFNGSAAVVVSGAIYGQTASTSATFRNIYVSPSASAPTGTLNNGDVWISF